jgi:hypothetical protein
MRHVAALFAVCLLVVVTFAFGVPLTVRAAESTSKETYFDFRNGNVPAAINFVKRSGEYIHPEASGLRITLPKEDRQRPRVIMEASAQLGGDFQVTTSFEILKADEPPEDRDNAVGILLVVAGPNMNARIGWEAPSGGRRVMWDRWDLMGKGRIDGGDRPADADSGRLRIQRTGKTVQYLWSRELSGENFEVIHQGDFGEDVDRIRLIAQPKNLPCSLDMRFLDLRVRGGPVNSPTPWLLMALLVLLGVSTLTAWYYVRQRRLTARTAAPGPDVDDPLADPRKDQAT